MTTVCSKNTLEALGMTIRVGRESDYGFVYDSWVNSLHSGNPVYKCIRMKFFKQHMRKLIGKALNPYRLNVVCDITNDDMIYGWCVHNFDGHLLYLYVQQLWRSKGIGTLLLESVPELKSYAGWTFGGRDWMRRRRLEYVPMEMENGK